MLAQLYLIIENRTTPVGETLIRFFSFFTILTNTGVAVYLSVQASRRRWQVPGLLTALTVYITIVGAVYQFLLRHIWSPTGLQMVVDELLHSVNPLLTIMYWYLYENKKPIRYRQVAGWLIYPLLYLVYILVRGTISGWYPYPFVDVGKLGLGQVLFHAVMLLLVFVAVALVYIRVGYALPVKNEWKQNTLGTRPAE